MLYQDKPLPSGNPGALAIKEDNAEAELNNRLARMQHVSSYVSLLRQKIGLYLGWTPETYANQVAEDNAYDMLKNDEVISTNIFLHAVRACGVETKVACDDSRVEIILNNLLSRIPDFTHSRMSLISNGMLFGLGVQLKK